MVSNNIRKFRKAKKLTLMEAADLIGISHTHLGRLETDKRTVSIPMARRIAQAWGVEDVSALIGLPTGQTIEIAPGFRGDCELFEEREGAIPKNKMERWRILRPVLVLAGIPEHSVVFVDRTVESVEGIKPLECVLAQYVDPSSGKMVPIARQFLPPQLLVTNSNICNEPSLNFWNGEAYLLGVIRGQYTPISGL